MAMKLSFITQLSHSSKGALASELEAMLEASVHEIDDECPHCKQDCRFAIDNPFEPNPATKAFLRLLIDALRDR